MGTFVGQDSTVGVKYVVIFKREKASARASSDRVFVLSVSPPA